LWIRLGWRLLGWRRFGHRQLVLRDGLNRWLLVPTQTTQTKHRLVLRDCGLTLVLTIGLALVPTIGLALVLTIGLALVLTIGLELVLTRTWPCVRARI